MINRIISFCLQQRLFIIGIWVLLAVIGFLAFDRLPIQAFPDVQNVNVRVVTQYPGYAPEEIEKLISLPIEKEMNGLPYLINMRSVSIFGLSVVTLNFDDDAEDYFSRQQVLERLRNANLPREAKPVLGPLTTGAGEIYRYRIEAPGVPLIEIRALQDWLIDRTLRSVQGVADVVSIGGGIKEYHVQVDPNKLRNYELTLSEIHRAIAANNSNIGGGYIEDGDEALIVRGIGLLKSADEIGDIVVTAKDGVPVFIKNIGEVVTGPQPRTGVVGYNGNNDVVEGVVMLLKGRNAIEVLERVKQKVEYLNNHGLPPGIQIDPVYDRTELIQHTTNTIERNMLEGAVLILLILIVFLRKVWTSVVIIVVIPLSLLFAFILIDFTNISANLISLGAIDFGIIVDSAVVLVEAIMVKITLEIRQQMNVAHMRQSMLTTATEMARPILFSKAILIIAFLPIFTFQQVEAKIFSPMAFALCFALLGSLIISLTLVPALLSYMIGPKLAESHNSLMHGMEKHYLALLKSILHRPRKLLIGASVALIISLASVPLIGTEFMPKLDEGNIWLTITLPTPISFSKAIEIEKEIRARLRLFSETKSVLSHLGRPEDGTDPKAFNNIEVLINLQPKEAWNYKNKEELVKAMHEKLVIYPGLKFNFSQVIQDNVEEAISGAKGEIAIKIFGENLKILQEKANQITSILNSIEGATDVAAEQQSGLAQLLISIDRSKIARYGINIEDV
ncbi:MAG: efflux RND transporter permease subunit, partial [Nitrosomonadales bacterium]